MFFSFSLVLKHFFTIAFAGVVNWVPLWDFLIVAITGVRWKLIFHVLVDDNRAYGYVRFETGDEMSRRAKFAFITWIGPSVPPLKKAKVSTDKAFVKKIWTVSSCLMFAVSWSMHLL